MERCRLNRTAGPPPKHAMLRTALLSILVFLSIPGCDRTGRRTELSSESHSQEKIRIARKVRVLAAASLKDAISDVAMAFENTQEDSAIQVITGPSNTLAQQIIAGAEASIYLTANPQWATVVEQQGLMQTKVPLVSNSLVLVAPKDHPIGVVDVEQLHKVDIGLVAIASPNVPLGTYTQQVFENLKFDATTLNNIKIIHASDAKQTLALVERGEVDAGIVYLTDALSSRHVMVAATIQSELHAPIVYPALLLNQALPDHDAEAFFNFLQSSIASEIFKSHGFHSLVTQPSNN